MIIDFTYQYRIYREDRQRASDVINHVTQLLEAIGPKVRREITLLPNGLHAPNSDRYSYLPRSYVWHSHIHRFSNLVARDAKAGENRCLWD